MGDTTTTHTHTSKFCHGILIKPENPQVRQVILHHMIKSIKGVCMCTRGVLIILVSCCIVLMIFYSFIYK